MEEEKLQKALDDYVCVFQMWLRGDIFVETLNTASIIRDNQGDHETEVTCGGEADLHRHYRSCHKNEGHSQFTPVEDFKVDHLPSGYRDNDLVDFIRADAELTCRLSVKYTSENRPECYPDHPHSLYPFCHDRGGDWTRLGTGSVSQVEKYTEGEKTCDCEVCSKAGTHTPTKLWGKVEITTACHLVFDDDEAKHTTCHFGYDTRTTLLSQCFKLSGLKVKESNVPGDRCVMTYVTHDMDILDKLDKMYRHRLTAWRKVKDKYVSSKNTGLFLPGVTCVTVPTPVVVISHPHGLSKCISVGMWTHRQTWSEVKKHDSDVYEVYEVDTSYRHNAATCPGSSGAPVLILPVNWRWGWLWTCHPHSEGNGRNNNDNKSGISKEFVSHPQLKTSSFTEQTVV